MIDSGATGLFMSRQYAEEQGFRRLRLKKPIQVFNIDGTLNQAGKIQEFVQLAITVDSHKHWVDILVTDLGGEELILGLPWLRRINPEIDWSKGLMSVKKQRVTIEEVPDREGEAVGGTTIYGGILEDSRDDPLKEEEISGVDEETERSEVTILEGEEEKLPKICVIKANRAQRRKW